MAKRRASRKMKSHSKRRHHRRVHRRTHRKYQGGVAPISYSLAGSWPSRMSLGQGEDYEQLHQGQHGGSAPYPASLQGEQLITAEMRGPAMTDTLDRALQQVAGLRDPPNDGGSAMPSTAMQQGAGRRRRRTQRRKGRKSQRRRKSMHRRRQQKGGMVLGYASVNSPGMLLSSQRQYSEAGLNPDYRGAAVEYSVAKARDEIPY
jgi:hypothetical protein